MANVDVCNLTWDSIKDNQIIYERIKFPKQAKPILITKAKNILEKYRGTGFENFIFPVFTQKHDTDLKRMRRVSGISYKLSLTLAKACHIMKIKEKLTWYSARGSFITRMVDEGYSLLCIRPPIVTAENNENYSP